MDGSNDFGVEGGAVADAASGDPAAASGGEKLAALASQTPLTNRGSVTPSGEGGVAFVGFDYLRLTVWASALAVQEAVEPLFERFGVEDSGVWKCVQGRRGDVYSRGVVHLPTYRDRDYVTLELKGEGCRAFGRDGLRSIGEAVKPLGEVRASRVDIAWDGFPMTVLEVRELLLRGQVNTRCRLDDKPWFEESETGRTVYTHAKPERRGIERYSRWYDMRGPVRFEHVMRGEWASGFWMFFMLGRDDLSALALATVRDFMDFVGEGERVDRAELHPLWRQFVGDAERVGCRQERERIEATVAESQALARRDAQLFRVGQVVADLAAAFGWDYVMRRLRFHAEKRQPNDEVVNVLKNRRDWWASQGVADVPAWPAEYVAPF